MFKLVIQDDEGKTTIVPLIRDEITIGRKEGNTIRLTERNVSRRHARILRNNGEVHIEDLGSYNGIRVNNARIAERVSLRVSDQVQIGDYKLYLKAEGLDQADDSRTTPIDRVEPGPTDSMPAVAAPAPTPANATPVPTAPPMIGNPNRTLVAMADTDPGRSVGPATAAAVAAMTQTAGYGKLVVLSSNFKGQEFELSRPQMIIGRTDENDIVINHRSISRNHAKLVREPDTARYTISDLQSSNGVRVNGSDYGKVELRRGDVIDLGHVRLRFVEAGEDFVFARDAVITDVPETGSRRGLLFALIAAIIVLVASVAIFTLRGGSDGPKRSGQNAGTLGSSAGSDPGSDSGSDTADRGSDTGSNAVAAGDDGSAAPAAVPPSGQTPTAQAALPAQGDKGQTGQPAKADDAKAKAAACAELEVNQKWQELRNCAAELAGIGTKDKVLRDKAEEFRGKSVKETAASLAADKLKTALGEGNLREAQKQLKSIGPDSVYYNASGDAFRGAETRAIDDNRRKAAAMLATRDCAGLKRLQTQVNTASTQAVSAAVAAVTVKCVDRVAAPGGAAPGGDAAPKAAPGGDAATAPQAAAPSKNSPCDAFNVDDAMSQAQNQYMAGFFKAALQLATKALGCRQDVRMYRFAATYACAAHDTANAKTFFAKVPSQFQAAIIQRCQQEGIALQTP